MFINDIIDTISQNYSIHPIGALNMVLHLNVISPRNAVKYRTLQTLLTPWKV